MPQRVLVLGGGLQQVPLIKKVKEKGYRVYLADYYPDPPGRRYCDEARQISSVSIEDNLQYSVDKDINYILTTGTDQPVLTAAAVSGRLGLPHPITPDQGIWVTHKRAMKTLMLENGLATPAFWPACTFEEVPWGELPYPVVIKPADSQGQRGIFVCPDRPSPARGRELFAEARKHSRTGMIIIEGFYPGDEITVNCWVKDGVSHILMITDRLHFDDAVALGICRQQRFPSAAAAGYLDEIGGMVRKLAEVFEIKDGPLYIQIMIGAEGPKIIEFGYRIGGGFESETIPRVTGVDILDLYVTLVTEGKNLFQPETVQEKARCGSIFFMLARPGRISTVTVPEEFSNGGLLFVEPKAEIGAIENATSRIGCFYFYTDTRAEYTRLLRVFDKGLAVRNDRNEDLLYHHIWE